MFAAMYKWYLNGSRAYHNIKEKNIHQSLSSTSTIFTSASTHKEDVDSIEHNSPYARIFPPVHHRPKFPLEALPPY